MRVCYLEQRRERACAWMKTDMTTENARMHRETQMSETVVEEMGEQANKTGEERETQLSRSRSARTCLLTLHCLSQNERSLDWYWVYNVVSSPSAHPPTVEPATDVHCARTTSS